MKALIINEDNFVTEELNSILEEKNIEILKIYPIMELCVMQYV